MKYWKTAVSVLAALSASLALAEDFKTTNGKEYKNATVTHVEPDSIVLKTKTGISKVYFTELPKDIRELQGGARSSGTKIYIISARKSRNVRGK